MDVKFMTLAEARKLAGQDCEFCDSQLRLAMEMNVDRVLVRTDTFDIVGVVA